VHDKVVRLHNLSTDEKIIDSFTKPLWTSLEGMEMFPLGSIYDRNIVWIFQYLSDRLDHVGIGPDVIFDGLKIRFVTRYTICQLNQALKIS